MELRTCEQIIVITFLVRRFFELKLLGRLNVILFKYVTQTPATTILP